MSQVSIENQPSVEWQENGRFEYLTFAYADVLSLQLGGYRSTVGMIRQMGYGSA